MWCVQNFSYLNLQLAILKINPAEDETRDSFPFDTMVDIMNDDISPFSSVSSGFAQVYLNGDWGPVCNMKIADADSFCRQLSYTNAVAVENRNAT